MFFRRPEHEVWNDFTSNRIHFYSVCVRVNPFRPNPNHDFFRIRQRPGLFKQKVNTPFSGVTAKEWCNANFKFEPLLYRRNLDREGRPEAPLAFCEAPASSAPNLKHCVRLLFGRLSKGWITATRQERYEEHQCVCSHSALLAAIFSARQKLFFAEFDTDCFTGQFVTWLRFPSLSAIKSSVEAEPGAVLPWLILQVCSLVKLLIVINAEDPCRRRRSGSRTANLWCEEPGRNAGKHNQSRESMEIRDA
jgi:hypothetical protein